MIDPKSTSLVGIVHGGILTFTGKMVAPFNPRPQDICLEDISHGASLTCRFSGQCKFFWSVAQHQLLVMAILVYFLNEPGLALPGMLHDSPEAYLTDIPRPFKSNIKSYKETENGVMDAIFTHFGLPFTHELDPNVKTADNIALGIEQAFLMPVSDLWPRILSEEQLDTILAAIPPQYIPYAYVPPHVSETIYMLKLAQLLEEFKDAKGRRQG